MQVAGGVTLHATDPATLVELPDGHALQAGAPPSA